MDLRALADFVLVATHGGFASASRASGQSKATLSRRVRELEEDLGFRLFDRDSRALRLTDEGEGLYGRVRGPLSEIGEAEVALHSSGQTPHGRLRISAPMLFAEVALGGIAASYSKAYPRVLLELVAEDRMVSPIEDKFDIIIRINPGSTNDLVGRCFYRERLQLVAPPSIASLLHQRNDAKLPSVVLTGSEDAPWRINGDTEIGEIHHEPLICASTMLMAYRAIISGAGAGMLPSFLVADDIASGRLHKLGDISEAAVEIWALHPSRRLNSLKVTSFLDHLTSMFPEGQWPARRLEDGSAVPNDRGWDFRRPQS